MEEKDALSLLLQVMFKTHNCVRIDQNVSALYYKTAQDEPRLLVFDAAQIDKDVCSRLLPHQKPALKAITRLLKETGLSAENVSDVKTVSFQSFMDTFRYCLKSFHLSSTQEALLSTLVHAKDKNEDTFVFEDDTLIDLLRQRFLKNLNHAARIGDICYVPYKSDKTLKVAYMEK